MTEYSLTARMLALAAILIPCSLALTWMLKSMMQVFPVDAVLFILSFLIAWLLMVCIVLDGDHPNSQPSASERDLTHRLNNALHSYNNLSACLEQAYTNNRVMAAQLEQQKKLLDEAKSTSTIRQYVSSFF